MAILLPGIALSNGTFRSNGRNIHLEVRCGLATPPKPAAIIFLHGSGGPYSAGLPYLDEESDLVRQGYCVYIPHYLDSTGGRADHPSKRYSVWIRVVEDTAKYIEDTAGLPANRIALVGYSLGASVALAAAVADPVFAAVVEFSGSLPDEYAAAVKQLPPLLIIHGRDDNIVPVANAEQLARLCDMRRLAFSLQIYPGEGHAFSVAARVRSKRAVEEFVRGQLPLR